MVIISPIGSLFALFTSLYSSNSNPSEPMFDPKLFLKVFCSLTIASSLLLTNLYSGYETNQRIKEESTLEKRIAKAHELKKDFKKECWAFKPLLFGEYLTSEIYLKKHKD